MLLCLIAWRRVGPQTDWRHLPQSALENWRLTNDVSDRTHPIDQVVSQMSPLKSNLNSSNTDGSFTMANSNSFLSPYEILSFLAQDNKYLEKFNFIMK